MIAEDLTRIQKQVLEGVISLTVKEGCPPTGTHAAESFGRNIKGTLLSLTERGYLKQSYARGPYVPVKDVDGKPLRLAVLPEGIAQEAESKAYRQKGLMPQQDAYYEMSKKWRFYFETVFNCVFNRAPTLLHTQAQNEFDLLTLEKIEGGMKRTDDLLFFDREGGFVYAAQHMSKAQLEPNYGARIVRRIHIRNLHPSDMKDLEWLMRHRRK